MEIRAKTIAEAHVKVCKAILTSEDREEYISEDGEMMWEYEEPILIIVEDTTTSRISPLCKFGARAFGQYAHDLLYGTDSAFVYTYHDRLFNYMIVNENGCAYPFDQIDDIIGKLKNNPTSRRAQAITWYPEQDNDSNAPPCLQRIQFMIRNGKLNMDVNFRSNDCLSAMAQNMYAFAHLHQYVSDKLEIQPGLYSHYITSAHMYPIRDKQEINDLKILVYK